MRSGRLRARIEIHKPVTVDDGHGGFTEAWLLDFKRWAEIEHVNGAESFSENKEQSTATYSLILRLDAKTRQITSRHRIKKGSNLFNVVAPPRERTSLARELVIDLEEVV